MFTNTPLNVSSILLVCMGNICRSPTAEAVFRHRAHLKQLPLYIESAGTIAYHTGETPDPRSRAAGEARGYRFDGITARKVEAADFERFDLILAADHNNLNDLNPLAGPYRDKLDLILGPGIDGHKEVPDPYYGGAQGFELVLDLIESGADYWLERIEQNRPQ